MGQGLTAAGAGVLAAGASRSRPAAAAGSLLIISGALAKRWSVFRAGCQAAGDPQQVIGPQRGRIRSGLTRGASKRLPPRPATPNP